MLGNHLAEIPREAWKTEGQIHFWGKLLLLDPEECLFFLIPRCCFQELVQLPSRDPSGWRDHVFFLKTLLFLQHLMFLFDL